VPLASLISLLAKAQSRTAATQPVAARSRAVRALLNTRPATTYAPTRQEETRMIMLHHGREAREIWVNPDLIETVEATPDTVVKLTTDRKLIVAETPQEILGLVVEFRRKAARPQVLGAG
jgi:flagellar protein FlbD